MKKLPLKKVVVKRGGFSREVNIPEKKNIPLSLVQKIADAKIGRSVRNPSRLGSRYIKVTNQLKRQAIMIEASKRIKALKR